MILEIAGMIFIWMQRLLWLTGLSGFVLWMWVWPALRLRGPCDLGLAAEDVQVDKFWESPRASTCAQRGAKKQVRCLGSGLGFGFLLCTGRVWPDSWSPSGPAWVGGSWKQNSQERVELCPFFFFLDFSFQLLDVSRSMPWKTMEMKRRTTFCKRIFIVSAVLAQHSCLTCPCRPAGSLLPLQWQCYRLRPEWGPHTGHSSESSLPGFGYHFLLPSKNRTDQALCTNSVSQAEKRQM